MSTSNTVVTVLPIVAGSLIASASAVSLLIYLSSKSTSPFNLGPSLALPTSQNEGLHPSKDQDEKDPFDIYDPVVFKDGEPLDGPEFWARVRRRKIALLVSLLVTAAFNIYILVDTLVDRPHHAEKGSIVLTSILAFSHAVCILYTSRSISFEDVTSHWASVIHLATLLSIDFLIAALFGLLPRSSSAPPPPGDAPMAILHMLSPSLLSRIMPLIPAILHFIPFILAVTIPRGPKLHIPLEKFLTAKAITSAREASAASLEPTSHNVCEEAQTNVIEWLIFSAATPVIWKAYKSETTELWELPAYLASYRSMPQFASIRQAYGKTQKTRGRAKSLFKRDGFNLLLRLAKVNKGLLTAQTCLAASTAVVYYLPAFFLNRVIGYLETDPDRTDMSWGFVYCFGLFASNVIVYLAVGVLWGLSTVSLQACIKLQLNTLLYSKTLVKKDIGGAGIASQDKALEVGQTKAVDASDDEKGSAKDKAEDDEDVNSKSQIMTLFTVDVDRVTEFVFHLFVLVDAPIEIAVATFFLVKLLGVSALFGLLATVLFMPLQHYASTFVVDTQDNLMKTRDERTALMNEILGGIRMLKFMAWERSFEKRVAKIRRKELGWLKRNYAIEVAFSCVWAITPIAVTVVAFLHFTLIRGEKLTPSIAFTSVGVFNELRFALNALPETFINILQGFVSCRRIEKYMRAAEVNRVENPPVGGNISLNSATITWPRDRAPDGLDGQSSGEATAAPSVAATPKAEFTLSDLNLSFPHGKLSLICGRLGSGKTLLLLGLLGEADLLAGQIICPRSTPNAMDDVDAKVTAEDWVLPSVCAYVPQQAWLQNASIKDNIVFCSPWDEQRYERVLDACSLRSDLNILEDGDLTEIGQGGINLSGGQKARVSLARAVYSRAGTLFLDDVISAVDALTAHALVEECLKGDLISGRTVIMVSHHTALVAPAAAYVVALEKGDVKFSGTASDFETQGLARTFDDSKDVSEAVKKEQVAVSPKNALVGLREPSSSSSSEGETSSSPETVVPTPRKTPRKLVEDEKKERGRVAKEVWFMYFKALGGPLYWMIFLLSMLIAMVVPVAENGWLRFWSGSFADKEYRHSPEFYVGWFAVISIVGNLLAQLKFVVIYAGSLRASRRLHDRLLESVLFATMRFHDTTNRGRLLNRFGKDVEGLDSATADNFVRSFSDATSLLATFVSITYVGGWPFLVATTVFVGLAYQAAKVYGPASRDMRRLDSITKSPLYSAFGDAVAGGSVIRAFGASTISLREMMRTADTNVLAYYWTWTVNRWCSARCAILSSGLIGCTAVTVLVAPGVTAAAAGFALAFSETISMGLVMGIRQFVRLEQSMVALERVKEYTTLPREAAEVIKPRPRASWPEDGDIKVEDLVIRYAPELPNVLHKISFEVKPKEHVGVVGSTGSGKSTLALSFFRFVEATEGRIVIDGLDISKMGLRDLRSRVTIIPQDPTILSGTLRSTLDVFDEYEDIEIYDALKRTHLLGELEDTGPAADAESDEGRNKNVFRDLSSMVNEGGDNFSQGEKQLMCMARAILKRNRLLIMDEATASVDYETDELISKTIREEFRESTILTIAHRIHTVIDFDKILVMDQGRIAEYASPAELLRNESSKFFALCKATGVEFKVLRDMAFAAEERRRGGGH